jgi:ABC-2 type transport system ATP-binding protein
VEVLNEELTFERQHLIGFTPDTPPVYAELTVRKFLHFVGLGYGMSNSEIAERTDFWLEKVWLTEKADQKLKGLSRGMRQRVGIARTMLSSPPVVLLDEPAAGLDPAGRVQFRQLLVSLREQGKTLIVSSHILSDLADYCTHVAIMSAGQMKRFGTVAAILAHADEHRRRYNLSLSRPVTQFERDLAAIEGVSNVSSDGRLAFTFDFHAGDEAAESLLGRLVREGAPVCVFTVAPINLEEAYLREGIRQVD